MENINSEIIKKIFKNYLRGKKHLNNDEEKALYYFNNVLTLIRRRVIEKYQEILYELEIKSSEFIKKLEEKRYLELSNYSTTQSSEIDDLNKIIKIINHGDISNLEAWLSDKKYVNWNIYDNNKMTPIHLAVKNGDCEMVKLMLKYGANINILNGFGHTPLEIACIEKNPNMINFLSILGVNLKKQILLRKNSKGQLLSTPNIDLALMIKLLTLEIKPDVEWKNKWTKINNKYGILKSEKLNQIFNSSIWEENSGWNNLTWDYVWSCLTKKITNDNEYEVVNICLDDLSEMSLNNYIYCPKTKIENSLYSLLPIFNFYINIKNNWMLNYELINLAKHLKKKYKKKEIFLQKYLQKIWIDYVENKILTHQHLNRLIEQWINKI